MDQHDNTPNTSLSTCRFAHRAPPTANVRHLVGDHLTHHFENANPRQKGRSREGGDAALFAIVYRRLVPRLGHAQAIGAITHRLCRLIWKLLHHRPWSANRPGGNTAAPHLHFQVNEGPDVLGSRIKAFGFVQYERLVEASWWEPVTGVAPEKGQLIRR